MHGKKSKFLILSIVLGILFLPQVVFGSGIYKAVSSTIPRATSTIYYRGLVPCGKEVCQLPDSVSASKLTKIESLISSGSSFQEACSSTDGGVKHGTSTVMACQFCHFLIMFNAIIQFALLKIITPLAVLLFVVAAGFFFWGGATGSPDAAKKGGKALLYVTIGFTLALSAYLIVGMFFMAMGVAQWTTLGNWYGQGAYNIDCPIYLPK